MDAFRCRRGGVSAGVGGRGLHLHPAFREEVLDAQVEREGVTRPGMEAVNHDHAMRLALGHRPGRPAHEPVDRVPLGNVVERQLMRLAPELVAPVLDSVGPRDQELTAAGAAHLAERVAVEQLAHARTVLAQAAAYLDDRRPLAGVGNLELLP
jgi:hypothetical protein